MKIILKRKSLNRFSKRLLPGRSRSGSVKVPSGGPGIPDIALNEKGIGKADLLDGDISESSINTLVKNKVLEEFEVVVPRFGF